MTLYFNVKFAMMAMVFIIACMSVGFVAGVIWRCIPMFIFILKTL